MKINELHKNPDLIDNQKLADKYNYLVKLISELNSRDIPDDIALKINEETKRINDHSESNRELSKLLVSVKSKVLRLIEKKLKLVPKNYYRNLWMVLGMSSFGIPLGVVYGFVLDSMAFIGIGLPIGMVIGMAVGSAMDKKAAAKGNQLSF